MIEFNCPGCTKPLEANRAFAGFETRCLRCGTVIRIPALSGDEAPVLSRAGLPKPKRVAPAPEPEPAFEPQAVAATATLEEEPARRRSLKTVIVVPEPQPQAEAAPAPRPARKARLNRKQKIVGGSIGGLIIVAVLLAIAFSGKGKPAAVAKKDQPAQQKEAPKPPEVEKKPEPPKTTLVVREEAPPPRAVRPPVEHEMTAAALLLEYGEGPAVCDQKYDGRDLLIRGIYHQYSLGKVTVVPHEDRSTSLAFTLLPPPPGSGLILRDPALTPGQPVVLRGTYRAGCRFTEASVELTDSPADRAYLGKSVCLDGAIVRSVNASTGSVPFPNVTLEPHATDTKLSVTCFFKVSDADEVTRLKPGQKIDVRGRCTGRSYTAIRLDNCAIVTPENPPGAEVTRLAADAFFTEYEADLVPYPRASAKDPSVELVPVTAEGLGHAYQVDPRSANLVYRNKPVQISGYVKGKHANTRMLVLQCGTDSAYSVAAVFSPTAFANLPEDKQVLIRGICSGVNGGYIRIESAENADLNAAGLALRTDVDFLPYRLGKEYIVDQITPGSKKDSPIKRMAIRFGGDDMIQVVVLKQGTFPGWTLLTDPLPEPKWAAYTPKHLPQLRRYRITEGTVEIGQPFGNAEKKEIQQFWEPVIKSGMKKGQSWSARFPDGKIATYTVMNLVQKEGKPDQLEIKRTLRDPKDSSRWEESGSTYLRGIGEVRRVITARTDRNEAVVLSETRLLDEFLRLEKAR